MRLVLTLAILSEFLSLLSFRIHASAPSSSLPNILAYNDYSGRMTQLGEEQPPPPASNANERPATSCPADEKDAEAAASSIAVPKLKYGYRTEPFEWPELVQILRVEKNLDKLCRTEEQQRDYMLYQRQLKAKWKSVTDFILCTKFDLEQRVDEETGLLYAHQSPISQSPVPNDGGGVRVRIMRNDFPYHMADGVEHWVLWKLGASCTEEDIVVAKEYIRKELLDAVDFLHWINPVHLKSLPDVDHVHILVKRDRS